jgi:cell division protein FtsW
VVATGTREPRPATHPSGQGAGSLAARRDARPWPRLGSSYFLILALVGTLLAVGLVMVLSASSVAAFARTGDSYTYLKRQAIWAGAGVILMLAVSRVDYRRWRRLALPLLALSLVLLLVVLVHPAAVSAFGSTRWIRLGPVTLQPAELAKLALLLFSADVLVRKERLLGDVRHLLVPVLPVMLLLAVLVLAEPDLGTTMLLCVIGFAMLFLAGTPLRVLGTVGVVGFLFAFTTMRGYQRARLTAFLDPGGDPQNTGFQLLQGHLAFGSGGLLGVGLGQSRQKWSFLPNAHTDFIFAVIGEELGLLGTLAVLGMFITLAYAGVRVARRSADPFGRYLAGGITVWIVVQALVNLGAVVGLLPITGVPLPLVSFGGSSMLVLLAALGMLLNLAKQEAWRPRSAVLATATTSERRDRRRPAATTPHRAGAGRAPGQARGGRAGGTPAQRAAAARRPGPAEARRTPGRSGVNRQSGGLKGRRGSPPVKRRNPDDR